MPPPTSNPPPATPAWTRFCPRSSCGLKSNWPKPGSSEAKGGRGRSREVEGGRGRPRGSGEVEDGRRRRKPFTLLTGSCRETPSCPVWRPPPILSVTGRRYIRRARTDPFRPALHDRWAGLGKVEELSTLRKRAFHERPPARLLSRQAAGLEGRDFEGIADHLADSPGRERQSS